MKKILVIDDAEFILESTSTLLKFEGYEVITAPDGEAGLEAAIINKPDLILCDISMPKLDGYGVLDKLRANEDVESIPFIFLTAYTEKSNMRIGMAKGADDFLVKPYSRDELIAAIEAQWSKHSRIERVVNEKMEGIGRSVTSALPHEFRTVLNEVIGSAKYLNNASEHILPDEIKDLSDDIITSANRLLKITESFLIYVRIESFASNPKKKAQLRNYTTEEPSALIVDIATNKASKYNRIADVEIDDNVHDITLQISSESFHKIFDELIDNAFKFSLPGTKVIVKTGTDKQYMYISIIDQGRGMSKEQITNIGALAQFERTIYEQQGVGLGLVIAKRMTELHDGLFFVESKEGEGSNISFAINYDFQAAE